MFHWPQRAARYCAVLLAACATPAPAVLIQFSSTATDITYFAGSSTPDAYVGLLGEPGSALFHGVNFGFSDGPSFSIDENVAVNATINRFARVGTAYSEDNEVETHRHNFVFSITSPGASPGSATISYDVTIKYIENGQFQTEVALVSPLNISFDLGPLGILDGEILFPSYSFQGVPDPAQGSAPGVSVRFLLHDVQAVVSEPGAAGLMGLALAGLVGMTTRRRRNARAA